MRQIQFQISRRYRSFLKTCGAYTLFVCFLIYLRRHARYSEARRNALASDYVPTLQQAVPYGRTSFRFASWNAFNPSLGSLFSIYSNAVSCRENLRLKFDAKVNLALHLALHGLLLGRQADISIRLNLLPAHCIESSFSQVTAWARIRIHSSSKRPTVSLQQNNRVFDRIKQNSRKLESRRIEFEYLIMHVSSKELSLLLAFIFP